MNQHSYLGSIESLLPVGRFSIMSNKISIEEEELSLIAKLSLAAWRPLEEANVVLACCQHNVAQHRWAEQYRQQGSTEEIYPS